MKLKIIPILMIASVLLLLSACSSARYVVIEPGGGVVAIPSNRPGNRQQALELMSGKCPGGFDIVREEEAPIGKVISGETTESNDTFDSKTKSREYTVRTRFEWHIHFRCR